MSQKYLFCVERDVKLQLNHSMVNVGPLTTVIGWRVCGTPANFNGFRVLASLYSRFDRQHLTEGTTYIRLGGPAITLGIGPHSIVSLYFRTVMGPDD